MIAECIAIVDPIHFNRREIQGPFKILLFDDDGKFLAANIIAATEKFSVDESSNMDMCTLSWL